MKPYLGILIDSFWEAIGNKVLWALLLGWSIILLALAPFGYVTERSFELSSADIDNRSLLIEKIADAAKGKGNTKVLAVVAKLDKEFLDDISRANGAGDNRGNRMRSSELAQGLNEAISNSDLYDAEAFPTAVKRQRLEPLITTPSEQRTAAEAEQLNRELLQLAFPASLYRPRGEKLWIGYAGFKIGDPLSISRRQISQFLEPLFLQIIIKFGLAVMAVFVAIIVTSPIIPDTFRSGSLHLLLSKPISRVWLYLSKFFGGSIFVLMNISFVLFGLYLIAGLRFEIWNSGLLACIPLLVFVFIIFYCVSALAGLIWGNAIVCVVAALIFWLFCFALGTMHDVMLPQAEVYPQISKINAIEERVTTVNEKGEFAVWNEEYSVWQPGLKTDVGPSARTFGPLFDPEKKQVIVKTFFRDPFGGLRARSRNIAYVDLQVEGKTAQASEANEAITNTKEAREKPLWLSEQGPELPQQVFDMLQVDNTVLAICRGGIFKLDMEKFELMEQGESGLFGIPIPWLATEGDKVFENISPSNFFISENTTAAATANQKGLIVYSSGNLDHLTFADGKFELATSAKLPDGDGTEAALVQMNDNYAVLARDGLPIAVYGTDLAEKQDVELPKNAKVKQLSWIPNTNRLSIVTHTGSLLVLDCEGMKIDQMPLPVSGKLTCIRWNSPTQAYIGVQPDRVYLVDVEANKTLEEFVPSPTFFNNFYGWLVKPLYRVTPKPAALDNAMTYLLSGSETQTMNIVTNSLEKAQIELDVWTPIFTNLAFVGVILGISCIYVARKEF